MYIESILLKTQCGKVSLSHNVDLATDSPSLLNIDKILYIFIFIFLFMKDNYYIYYVHVLNELF